MMNWVDQHIGSQTQGKIPYVTGNLVTSSVGVIGKSKVVDTGFEAWIGFDADYATYVNYGRPPGFPPVAEIREWCINVGLPEEAVIPITRKIGWHGYQGKHFFEPMIAYAKTTLVEELHRAFTTRGLDPKMVRL